MPEFINQFGEKLYSEGLSDRKDISYSICEKQNDGWSCGYRVLMVINF